MIDAMIGLLQLAQRAASERLAVLAMEALVRVHALLGDTPVSSDNSGDISDSESTGNEAKASAVIPSVACFVNETERDFPVPFEASQPYSDGFGTMAPSFVLSSPPRPVAWQARALDLTSPSRPLSVQVPPSLPPSLSPKSITVAIPKQLLCAVDMSDLETCGTSCGRLALHFFLRRLQKVHAIVYGQQSKVATPSGSAGGGRYMATIANQEI